MMAVEAFDGHFTLLPEPDYAERKGTAAKGRSVFDIKKLQCLWL